MSENLKDIKDFDFDLELDEHYFVALVNEAVALGDVRSAKRYAAQYGSAHHAESGIHRLARRLHLARAA